MRTLMLCIALLFASIASARPATVEARPVVAAGGSELPTRDGAHLRVGALIAPLAVARAEAVAAEVRVDLDEKSGRAFADASARHVGERIALIVDGVIVSAPVLRDPIVRGKLWITLRSPADAQSLARALTQK